MQDHRHEPNFFNGSNILSHHKSGDAATLSIILFV